MIPTLIPVCAWCKHILTRHSFPRRGKLTPMFEEWIHSLGHKFSHGICIHCYGNVLNDKHS